MLKVGVTGGIGSGKTLVCKVFSVLGVPVFNADNEAKKIINNDINIISKVKNKFGDDIYSNQMLDRSKLAEIVFKNQEALKELNSIVHPKVREQFLLWCKQYQELPYIIEEAAILFESGAYKEFDITINIHSPEKDRIERIIQRDKVSEKQVLDRMMNQISDSERINLANYTIYNENNKMILSQILDIHNILIHHKTK